MSLPFSFLFRISLPHISHLSLSCLDWLFSGLLLSCALESSFIASLGLNLFFLDPMCCFFFAGGGRYLCLFLLKHIRQQFPKMQHTRVKLLSWALLSENIFILILDCAYSMLARDGYGRLHWVLNEKILLSKFGSDYFTIFQYPVGKLGTICFFSLCDIFSSSLEDFLLSLIVWVFILTWNQCWRVSLVWWYILWFY